MILLFFVTSYVYLVIYLYELLHTSGPLDGSVYEKLKFSVSNNQLNGPVYLVQC